MKYHNKKLLTLLGGALVGVGAFLVAPEGALAVRSADTTGTYEICAETLYLRAWASGPAIDTLKGGTHFEVTSHAGEGWVKGYSYWAQQSGWVQNGWFC